MDREDLMKADPLSKILLLSGSIVIVAALATLVMLALARTASALPTTSPSATFCKYAVSHTRLISYLNRLDIAV
jgi:hypothetical protein